MTVFSIVPLNPFYYFQFIIKPNGYLQNIQKFLLLNKFDKIELLSQNQKLEPLIHLIE
jgi:hypothetical protein